MDSFLHIGFDDTDSTQRGCTTYVAALLIEELRRLDAEFVDYPNLVRLNPNVPWKTRGNGALCLRLKIDASRRRRLVERVVETVAAEADLDFPGTDPGIVLYEGKDIPQALTDFARKTLHRVVRKEEAVRLITRFHCESFCFKRGRGLIGAVAAIGEPLFEDHTYELIAYRHKRNRGSVRQVDGGSVFEMDEQTRGLTFSNVDYGAKRILITPRGPDPVLLGIRGECPDGVKTAFGLLTIHEDVERWVIFRTNQGTDAHLIDLSGIRHVRPHSAVVLRGSVIAGPRPIPGRHVIVTIGDEGGCIDCAAYEPTGKFRNVVRRLVQGDVVEVAGGVRPASSTHPLTLNLEKLTVLKLASSTLLRNPVCYLCGKRMESMGTGKGFRCKKCGRRDRGARKIMVPVERALYEGLCLPPPCAHRHLMKPRSRYGREKHVNSFPTPLPGFWGLGNYVPPAS